MDKVLTFRGEIACDVDRYEAVFVYVAALQDDHTLDRAVADAVQSNRVSPDIVIFLTPITQSEKLKKALNSDLLSERFEQIKRCKAIVLCPFDGSAQPEDGIWIRTNSTFSTFTSSAIIANARESGLEHLATSRDGIVTLAPPGTYFRNPSGGPRSYFMRAGLMCRNSVDASFIAFALLQLVYQASRVYSRTPNIIWVDTVGIAYIAYALSALGEELDIFAEKPEIRSFSSYAGYKQVRPSSNEFPIYIISASTSGGLAKDIIRESQNTILPEVITTILGAYEAEFPQVLYTLPQNRRGPYLSSIETLREIRVTGEDFLFHPGEPISVELKRTQLPRNFRETFSRIQGKNLIHCFKRASAVRPAKPFFLDGNRLVQDTAFKEWVTARAAGSLPVSVRRIVYQEDDASKRMADIVSETLESFHSTKPYVSSIREIESLSPNPKETVAVVAAVAGSGMELMRATKALRVYQPQGSRHFLVGVLFGRTYAQLRQLKVNLQKSDEYLRYSLETWCEFASSANAVAQFRERELSWLRGLLHGDNSADLNDDALVAFANDRLKEIGADGIVRHESEMPCEFVSLSGCASVFSISEGFALWRSPYLNKQCPSDVLFTVACWLQNARENKEIHHADRLDDGGFGQTAIAPDCFLRFTDPVIQSSILRCARDSELDYRSSQEISARAAEILSKFCSLKEQSIIEFLMAIAFYRLRLCDSDALRIVNAASKYLISDSRVKSLLKLICHNYSLTLS